MAENQTVTQRMDPATLPYYRYMMDAAQAQAGQPYLPYAGQRIAGLTGLEAGALQGMGQLAQQGLPAPFQQGAAAGLGALHQWGGAGGQGYGDLSGLAGAYNQGMTAQMWPGADQAAYMNPYQQNVTDVAAREIEKMGNRQLGDIGSQAALGGAFGGSRHAMLEGEAMRGTRQQIGDLAYQGQRDSYLNAQNQFNADRDAAFRGLGGQQQALMGANQLFQSGAQGLMGAAMGMGELGGMQQGMNLDMLNAMNQFGQGQRGVQQAMFDVGYQDFLRQQQHPREQLGFMSNIFSGLPNTGVTDFYQQRQPTSLFGGTLGAGLGAAATWGQTQPPGPR